MSSPARSRPSNSWWRIDAAGFAALAGLTLAAWFLVVRPMAAERAAVTAVRGQLVDSEREASRLKGSQRRLQTRLEQMRAELDASALRLQPAARLNRRLALIVEQATASGLEINGTRAGDVASGERYDMVPIEVAGEGSFSSCAVFLHRLQANLPDVEVLAFELSGRGARSAAGSAFRFDLRWYAAATMASGARGDEEP